MKPLYGLRKSCRARRLVARGTWHQARQATQPTGLTTGDEGTHVLRDGKHAIVFGHLTRDYAAKLCHLLARRLFTGWRRTDVGNDVVNISAEQPIIVRVPRHVAKAFGQLTPTILGAEDLMVPKDPRRTEDGRLDSKEFAKVSRTNG